MTTTQPPASRARPLTDKEELRKAQKIARNAVSNSYISYALPELSNQLDKHGQRMIAYPCQTCGTKINRPTSDSSCSNLLKHASICPWKKAEVKSNSNLASHGVGGTGDINPKEIQTTPIYVPQLCAIWCSEAARPFSALSNPSHLAILHPTVVKNLPCRWTVLRDIHMLYSAVQQSYHSVLKAHKGALYLGVDGWQSPNGFDILGIMIYRLDHHGATDTNATLEAMPLNFICLSQNHTGEYLAEMVRLVVEKFGIPQKICGIVTNNASNNQVMVNELKKRKWACFQGEAQWVRCFAHVLNLIVKSILRPFGAQKKENASNDPTATTDPDDSDGLESSDLDAAEQIRLFTRKMDFQSDEEDIGSKGDSIDGHDSDAQLLNLDDIDTMKRKMIATQVIAFCAVAKKLKHSPNSNAEFCDICCKLGCPTPHTVERDVCTQWNSTLVQLRGIIRCKDTILEWQRNKRHGINRKYHLNTADFDLAHNLVDVLNLFYEITLQVLVSGLDCLAHIVMFIDQITKHLLTAIITNKYYALTNTSPLYRIAIVLHPSFRDEYFKLAKWELEWIAEAIQLNRDMWVTFYKPQSTDTTPVKSSTINTSSKPRTSMLARWWLQQKKSGKTHSGLLYMALDVLSCPATSVDVKRAFSFGRD
ncbi:hypothetical protein PTTG_28118 [Puccinia triticina 1-1 BBBD Race 1]|uniref:HAT C-terminal dimerisation domain-containing protein n=1 Tax=Puccinia triticina (isolate 1-1 / race 1 (BBBD)) TaxID=630390 RepID=A0A180GE41_PUCT1|nr:hypothetical protein PTTG_28118 [Puccinia triticina 1-1 BBBD Race 1]